MKAKMLSILLCLVTLVAFTGIASAATQQVLVSEAYDEQVLVTPAYNESVLVSEAYDEQVLVSPESTESISYQNVPFNDVNEWCAWIYSHSGATGGWGSWNPQYETVHHDAVYQTVHHDAVYQTVHHDAVYETVIVEDEPAVPAHDEAMEKDFNNGIAAHNWIHSLVNSHKIDSEWDAYTTQHKVCNKWVYTVHWTEQVPGTPAVTHEEQQLVSEAYDEQVLVSDAYDEEVLVSEAYDEQVLVNYLVSGEYNVYNAAVYENVHHDAVYNVIEHAAVFETVHHDAVYKTVEVADPVVPVVDPVAPVDDVVADEQVDEQEPASIPMQNTGGSTLPLAIAALAIIAGLWLMVFPIKKDDEEDEE